MENYIDECKLLGEEMTKLREIREKQGLSIAELSKRTGIPYRTIQDLDTGALSINKSAAVNVYKISKVLRVKMESLIDTTDIFTSEDVKNGKVSKCWCAFICLGGCW